MTDPDLHAHVLAANELAQACGAELTWVVELVEVGVLQVEQRAAPAQEWRFAGSALGDALAVRRLQRDFDVNLDAAALILDLQHEIRHLKAILQTRGLGHELARIQRR